jgi:hypothetical protein
VESYIDLGANVVAVLALAVSVLAWRAAMLAGRAAAFERRFEIYRDAETFISAWQRDGSPNMAKLPLIVGAWSRSQFLCSEAATSYLKAVWDDAVSAAVLRKVASGELPGEPADAVLELRALTSEHADLVQLRAAFMSDLKIGSGSTGRTLLRVIGAAR